jgi:hypothetical protein
MNADQRANIDAMVKALVESLFSAWNYLHLLQGFHSGSKTHPVVVQQFNRLFDQLWRAVFDGLFAKAGTLIDRTKGTYSLPNLLAMTRRYGGAELKLAVANVETRLNALNGPLAKIESWRHQVVAHRTPGGRDATFYIDNKMKLEDIAAGLTQLEELLNAISLEVFRVHNDTETGSEDLVQQGAAMFACLAETLECRTEKLPS